MAQYGTAKYDVDFYEEKVIPDLTQFLDYREDRVLGQTTPSTNQPGVCAGPLEIGAMSVPFGYYDEAGRWYSTTSKHTFEQKVEAGIINVPDSENHQTVLNVGARFSR